MSDTSRRETTGGSTGASRPPPPRVRGESGFYRVGHGGRRISRVVREPTRPARRWPRRRGRRPARTPEDLRFAEVYAAAPTGPLPYPDQAVPDVALVRARVRELVDDLRPDRLDGDTVAAVEGVIAGWAAGWLACVDTEALEREAAVDRLVGAARHRLAAAQAAHERDLDALAIARDDDARARERLDDPTDEIALAGPRRWWTRLRWTRRWWTRRWWARRLAAVRSRRRRP